MNQEFKTIWLEALRSGNYVQGQHTLRNGGTFCCLGVACDLALKTSIVKGKWTNDLFRIEDPYCTEDLVLPPLLSQIFDLDPAGILLKDKQEEIEQFIISKGYPLFTFGSDGNCASLTYINDKGVSFIVIADLIEKYL